MGSTQAHIAEQLGFNQFLIISSDFEKSNSRTNEKLLKDALEAFIGAIEKDFDQKPQLNLAKKGYQPYLGFGYQVATEFVVSVIETHIDIGELMLEARDYVDEFDKIMRSSYKKVEYIFQGKEKINGQEMHKCVVKEGSRILGTGYAKNQKDSKRNCAKNALLKFRNNIL